MTNSTSYVRKVPRQLVQIFSTWIFLLSAAQGSDSIPATLSLDQLRSAILDTQSRIYAWRVVYESDRNSASGDHGAFLHREVAAKSPDRFFHWSSHGYPQSDWRDDLYQQRLTLSSNFSVVERPGHRQFRFFSLSPTSGLPGSMPGEFLFFALGWWPFSARPAPTLVVGAPTALTLVATSQKYKLQERMELVGGAVVPYPGISGPR